MKPSTKLSEMRSVLHAQKRLGLALTAICILGCLFLCAQKSTITLPEMPPFVLPVAKMNRDDGQDAMGSRLFKTTATRLQVQLGGFWDFITDQHGQGEAQKYFERFPNPETRMWIPGTWNTYPRYWHYQGPTWLRRTFTLPQNGHWRFRFGGVFYLCKVWLDGRLLGEHEGAYSPFTFVATNIKMGQHTLIVRADSTLTDDTLPSNVVDWFPYGGIFRPIYAELVPDSFIDGFHVIPSNITAQAATVSIKVFTRNLSAQPSQKRVSLEIDGQQAYSGLHQLNGADSTIEFKTVLKNPKLWAPSDPILFSARVVLGEGEDDQFSRFGVRSFAAAGNRILLNGRHFKLMGANRHDDHPDWGSALPPQIIRQDIEILKRMGANAVRGHYPPDEMFMDYCDANGLVFMNEIPAWQYQPGQLARQTVQEKMKSQFRDMVYRDMNHPSVFSWSLGNEWPEFDKSQDVIKTLLEYARAIDSTHFITFVTGGAHTGRVTSLVDIICTNWAQYQWYEPMTYLDKDDGERSIAVLNAVRSSFPDKPVILTEFGGAESQAGWHNWGNVKWSEEYQARNVFDSGGYALDQDWISGGCVWQFCDTRSNPLRILGGRLRGWNAKGVVDSYRSPKMAFYKLQELFHQHANEQAKGGSQ